MRKRRANFVGANLIGDENESKTPDLSAILAGFFVSLHQNGWLDRINNIRP